MTELGDLFRKRREERHLGRGQLARLAGYRNLSKAGRNIHQMESSGIVAAELVAGPTVNLGAADCARLKS